MWTHYSRLAWTALPIHALQSPVEINVVFSGTTVPVYLGMPPQQLELTIDLSADWLAAYAYDCILCSGESSFNPLLSNSFQASTSHSMYSEFMV